MPRTKSRQTHKRTAQRLRAAEAEIRRLRHAAKNCHCRPLDSAERARKIQKICDLVANIPPGSYKKRAELMADNMMADMTSDHPFTDPLKMAEKW